MRNNFAVNTQGYQSLLRQQIRRKIQQGVQNIANQAGIGQSALRTGYENFQPVSQNHLSGMSEAVDVLAANLQRQQQAQQQAQRQAEQAQRQAEQAARQAQRQAQQQAAQAARQAQQQVLLAQRQQAAQAAALAQQSQPLALQPIAKKNSSPPENQFRMGGGSFGGGAGRDDIKRMQAAGAAPDNDFLPQGILERVDRALTEWRNRQDEKEKAWLPAMEQRAKELPAEDALRFWEIAYATQGRDRDEKSAIPGQLERELKDRGYGTKDIAEMEELFARKANKILTDIELQKRKDLAEEHPWTASAVSVADNFLGEMQQPVDYALQMLGQSLTGNYAPLDTNRSGQQSVKKAEAARQTVRSNLENYAYIDPETDSDLVRLLGGADKVNQMLGKGGGMLYTGAMGGADYMVKSALWGPFANELNAIFSAGHSITDAVDRGATTNEALDYAKAAAAIDFVSGGAMNTALAGLDPNGGIGSSLAKIGIRGLGSAAGQGAKEVADLRTTGENSALWQVGDQAYQQAVRAGSDDAQAQAAARQAMQKRLLSDGLDAFKSGTLAAAMDEGIYGMGNRAWQSKQGTGEALVPQSGSGMMMQPDENLPRWPVLPVRSSRQAMPYAKLPKDLGSEARALLPLPQKVSIDEVLKTAAQLPENNGLSLCAKPTRTDTKETVEAFAQNKLEDGQQVLFTVSDSSYGRIGSDGNIYLNAGLSPQSAEKTLAAQVLTKQLQDRGCYDGLVSFIEGYAPGKSWLNTKSRDLLEWHEIDAPLKKFSDYVDYIQQRYARNGRTISRESALQEAAADWCAENLLGRKKDGEADSRARNYGAVKALIAYNEENAEQIDALLSSILDDENNAFSVNYARAGGKNALAKIYIKPYTYSRPSYRKGLIEEVWERCKDENGIVRDPHTKEIIEWEPGQPRDGVWDMGHKDKAKYEIEHQKYLRGEISLKEFLDWYNNPDNYWVELPSNNRSHRFEKVK